MKRNNLFSIITTLLIVVIFAACTNSSSSSGSSSTSKPDYTGYYEAENGNNFDQDCSDEALEEIKELAILFGESNYDSFDGVGSFSYEDVNGKLHINLKCPFTISEEKVIFDDKEHTTVTISGNTLTDATGRTYTKKEKVKN